jgi:hypothetical protein
MDFNTLHKQRKFVMIAAAIGILGTFLNWYKWEGIAGFGGGGGIKGTSFGAGVITLIALGAAGVFAYLGDQKSFLSKNSWLITLGASSLAAVLCVIKLISGPGGSFALGNTGLGLYMSTAGAIGTLAAAFIYKNPNDDLKESLNEMKKQVENKVDNNPNT